MNSLKPLIVLAILGGAGYFVWQAMNKDVRHKEPDGLPPDWATAPQVQVPNGQGAAPPPGVGTPPGVATPPGIGAVAGSDTMRPLGVATPPVPAGGDAPPFNSGRPAGPAGAPPPFPPAPAGNLPPAVPPAAAITPPPAAPVVPPPAPATLPNVAGGGWSDFGASMAGIQKMLDGRQLGQAHKALSQLYENPVLSPSQKQQALDLLNRVAGTVVYSHRHDILEPRYTVVPGDTLESIALRYRVTPQLLAKINGLKGLVVPSQTLKVVTGPFDAKLNLSEKRMTLWISGCYAGAFPVGLGEHAPQPGEYVVKDKLAADAPQNELHAPWIDIGNDMGLHGVADAALLERPDFPGSIGLRLQDADDVFDILSVGSRIIVRR